MRSQIFKILLVWAGFHFFAVSGKVVPFLEPGFFFDYNVPGQPVPIPITAQCETIHLEWSRQAAIGANPVAPYSLQVYTSTFITPFLVPAGSGLTFDWDVPFSPGTQYQICMFDANGVSGGCQAMYTVIQNTTDPNPTCQNVTFPATPLEIVGTVASGPLSQFGFVDQCTDISITPKNGTPPFTLTIAPPLAPPYNLTSHTMDPIVWTVSLGRAFPFFMSLVSSEGLVWANGPMHSGGFGPTDCLAPGTVPAKKAHSAIAGAAVGGLFGGALILAVAATFWKYWRRNESQPAVYADEKTSFEEMQIGSPLGLGTPRDVESASPSSQPPDLSQVYVVHHDAGGAPVTVYTRGGRAEVVELPPSYNNRQMSSVESQRRSEASPAETRPSNRALLPPPVPEKSREKSRSK